MLRLHEGDAHGMARSSARRIYPKRANHARAGTDCDRAISPTTGRYLVGPVASLARCINWTGHWATILIKVERVFSAHRVPYLGAEARDAAQRVGARPQSLHQCGTVEGAEFHRVPQRQAAEAGAGGHKLRYRGAVGLGTYETCAGQNANVREVK